MKTIEEKARAYDEVLNKLRHFIAKGVDPLITRADVQDFFPELKESEDEKVRKELIKHLKEGAEGYEPAGGSSDYQRWLAWVEKQKEPLDKGEISDGYHTFNELYYYRMLYNAAFFNLLPKEWVHKSRKHHTGEECFGGGWFIVMAELPTGQISNHYEMKDWDLFDIPEKDVANEWDGHTPQEAAERLHNYLFEKQGEQQNKVRWTEHDRTMAFTLMRDVDQISFISKEGKNERIGWLNNLDEKFIHQPKQEWSEEDEKIINGLIDSLTRISLNTRTDSTSPNFSFYKEIDWLKSLRPQNRWKPSELQLGCLSDAIEHYNSLGYPAPKLKELLDDLKELKGEV